MKWVKLPASTFCLHSISNYLHTPNIVHLHERHRSRNICSNNTLLTFSILYTRSRDQFCLHTWYQFLKYWMESGLSFLSRCVSVSLSSIFLFFHVPALVYSPKPIRKSNRYTLNHLLCQLTFVSHKSQPKPQNKHLVRSLLHFPDKYPIFVLTQAYTFSHRANNLSVLCLYPPVPEYLPFVLCFIFGSQEASHNRLDRNKSIDIFVFCDSLG